LEKETLTCPLCGAPYRETIPSGVVQVKCRYCGGTILVPPALGGEVYRCPNHPDVLVVSLCNDCGESYCDSCLYFYDVRDGTLNLCPSCFRNRQTAGAKGILTVGILLFLLASFAVVSTSAVGDKLLSGFFLVISLPMVVWGIYRNYRLPKGVSVKEKTEAFKQEMESRKAFGARATQYELYNRLLHENIRDLGADLGMRTLERRIDLYLSSGMSRSEAVKKIAEERGY